MCAVLAAINTTGRALQFASEELKNNLNVVEAAIRHELHSWTVFKHASQEIESKYSLLTLGNHLHTLLAEVE